jgi:hypothetical protein
MYYDFRFVSRTIRIVCSRRASKKPWFSASPLSGSSGMNDANPAIDKLQRIQQLWAELGRTKLNGSEYRDIMKNIRALSAEYQALVDAFPKPGTSR